MHRTLGIAARLGLLLAVTGLGQLAQAQSTDGELRNGPADTEVGREAAGQGGQAGAAGGDQRTGPLVVEIDRGLLLDGFNLLALQARGVGLEDDRFSLAVSLASNVDAHIQFGDPWYYLVAEGELPADWNQLGHDHGSWNVGLSRADDGAEPRATAPRFDLLIAKPFRIADPADVTRLELLVDHDDAFTAYLNGHLVAQAERGPAPARVAEDSPAAPGVAPAPSTAPVETVETVEAPQPPAVPRPALKPEGTVAMTAEAPPAAVEPATPRALPPLEPEVARTLAEEGMGGPAEALPIEPEMPAATPPPARPAEPEVAAAEPIPTSPAEPEVAAAEPMPARPAEAQTTAVAPSATPPAETGTAAVTPAETGRDEKPGPQPPVRTAQGSTGPETSAPRAAAPPPMILRGSAIAPKAAKSHGAAGGDLRIAGGKRLWMLDPATQDVHACSVRNTTEVDLRVIRCVSGTAGRYHRGFGRTFRP